MHKIINLSNGQKMSYLELGNPGGVPLIYFHGYPGSSKQVLILDQQNILEHFHIYAIDRPGFGDSTTSKDRKITDIESDFKDFLENTKIEKFHIVSVSGGTPYAYIVANANKERVLSLTTISGLGPIFEKEFFKDMSLFFRPFLKMGKSSPLTIMALMKFIKFFSSKNKQYKLDSKKLSFFLCPADIKILSESRITDSFRESMIHAFKQGVSGVAQEIQVFQMDWKIKDWNFPFPVYIWHGEDDTVVPLSHSQLLARRIENAKLQVLKKEGHYSVPINYIQTIFKELLSTT